MMLPQLADRVAQVDATHITIYPQCLGDPYEVFEEQLTRIAEQVLPKL